MCMWVLQLPNEAVTIWYINTYISYPQKEQFWMNHRHGKAGFVYQQGNWYM